LTGQSGRNDLLGIVSRVEGLESWFNYMDATKFVTIRDFFKFCLWLLNPLVFTVFRLFSAGSLFFIFTCVNKVSLVFLDYLLWRKWF